MFKQAIVRTPSKSVAEGLTTVDLGKPDYSLALKQHQSYIQRLKQCGIEVTVLPPCDDYPDACFVEDVAIVTADFAVLTKPGAPTRQGEVSHIEETINKFFPNKIERMQGTGSLEGGDVMQVGSHFFIGLSNRTNQEGSDEFSQLVAKYGYTTSNVDFSDVLHLKTGVSYIGDNTLIASGELAKHVAFKDFTMIEIPHDEWYAANALRAGDKVILSQGFKETLARVKGNGFEVLEIDSTEFQKIDGSLTCLSLRF